MNIKLLSAEDWQKFKTIRLAGLQSDPQAFGGDMTEEINRQEPEWRRRLSDLNRFYFGAEDDGTLIAIAGARKIDDQMWMLNAVHTLPEYRGKGLAQEIIKYCLDEARKRGASKMSLMVNVDQKDAIHIYEKLGFQSKKILPQEKMSEGSFHDSNYMEKDLVFQQGVAGH